MSRTYRRILGTLGAIGLVALSIFLLAGNSSAAPAGANPQSDYGTVSGTVDANGYVTLSLKDPIAYVDGDTQAFVTIVSPSAGVVNLPNSMRRIAFVVDDKGTKDVADDAVTGVTYRVFGHQLRLDPNGNYRQNVYAGPIEADQKVVSGAGAYCSANACS